MAKVLDGIDRGRESAHLMLFGRAFGLVHWRWRIVIAEPNSSLGT